MKQYRCIFSACDNGVRFGCGDAYALYGAFLELVSAPLAERLHSQEHGGIAQYLVPFSNGKCASWYVSVLDNDILPEVETGFAKAEISSLRLHSLQLKPEKHLCFETNCLADLLKIPGDDFDCPRFHLRFLSPTAFRSGGEYVFMPSVKHLLGSLSMKGGAAFPFSPVNDSDALEALERGTRITGYNLQSVYFPLKGRMIPAFTGSITLNAKLAAPLLQLLRGLLSFGSFSGVGIKTTLGMGGYHVKESLRDI